MSPRLVAVASIVALVAALSISGSNADNPPPLLGVTFTHSAVEPSTCNFSATRTGIVDTYHLPGVRRLVRAQLATMKASGIDAIRILLWFQTDTTGHTWGVIPSAGGRVSEPWRSNLIRFSQDIKAAGLERFTIHFSPQWANDPIGLYGPNGRIQDVWDPAKLEENWGFIRNARTLVKQYGPATTLFDIFSEGAMSPYAEDIPRVQAYTAELWRRYASAFGVEDVTISVIGKGRADEASDRVRNLVTAIRSTGLSLPRWFEIHPDFDGPQVLAELNAFDATLRELGLDQPLVLGEMSYENASVAAAVAEFVRTSQRHVIEVYEWPQTIEGGPCPPPPYRADAYRTALTGQAPKPATPLTLAPIPSLRASVATAGQVTLTTSNGTIVTTLDAGRYRILVDDRSTKAAFHLSGPNLNRSTARRFVGRRTWVLDIGLTAPFGSVFRYGADPERPGVKRLFVR